MKIQKMGIFLGWAESSVLYYKTKLLVDAGFQ